MTSILLDAFKFSIAVLATWRFSAILCIEGGPFNIIADIRRVIYAKSLPTLVEPVYLEEEIEYHRNIGWEFIYSQISCFWCTSIWVALIAAFIVALPGAAWYALVPHALSGAAILLSGGGRTVWRKGEESNA